MLLDAGAGQDAEASITGMMTDSASKHYRKMANLRRSKLLMMAQDSSRRLFLSTTAQT
jgi:hypothetical protein